MNIEIRTFYRTFAGTHETYSGAEDALAEKGIDPVWGDNIASLRVLAIDGEYFELKQIKDVRW